MGISPFEETDGQYFFGRGDLVEHLLDRVQRDSFVALVGESGSGKSSVLRAGLIPELRRQHWEILLVRAPGSDPFSSLAAELLREHPSEERTFSDQVASLATSLERNGISIELDHALDTRGGKHMLLVLDQFEEIFTQCQDDQKRGAFVRRLIELVQRPISGQPTIVLGIAMRSDYLRQLEKYPDFQSLVRRASLGAPMPDRRSLRSAIGEPARKAGAVFEEGLVDRILDELANQPASLAHLEFTLTELWHEQRGHILTHAAYIRLGGVANTLARQADRRYEQLSKPEQDATRRVLTLLVQLAQDTKGTNRLITVDDLLPGDWKVVEVLADARLVVTGCDDRNRKTARLAHETLVTAWPRLQEWVDSAAEQVWRFDRDADRVIRKYVAFGMGAAGLPFADVLAVPSALAQMGRELGRVYKVEVDASSIKAVAPALVVGASAALVGGGYMNFFRVTGAGYLAAWTVEAALIAPLMFAVGNAWKYYFRLRFLGGGAPSSEEMTQFVKVDLNNRLSVLKQQPQMIGARLSSGLRSIPGIRRLVRNQE